MNRYLLALVIVLVSTGCRSNTGGIASTGSVSMTGKSLRLPSVAVAEGRQRAKVNQVRACRDPVCILPMPTGSDLNSQAIGSSA